MMVCGGQYRDIKDEDSHLSLLGGGGITLAVTCMAEVSCDRQDLIRPLFTHVHTREDTFTCQRLVPPIQVVIVKSFIPAFLILLAQLRQPFLIFLLGSSTNARLVLVGAHNTLVLNVGVGGPTTKALVTSSQFAMGTVRGIRAATLGMISAIGAVGIVRGIPSALGVTIQSTFGLTSEGVGSKGSTTNGVVCDGTD